VGVGSLGPALVPDHAAALFVVMGLLLPFPWDLVPFAVAGGLLWWRVRPELDALITGLRQPAAPMASTPAVAPRSAHELRLLRREIAIDCALLVGMLTAGRANAIDIDLRLALVAAALAALIVNGFLHARLKDRARWVATVMERAGLDALAQPPSEIAMDLMLSDRTIRGAAASDLVCIGREDFAILSDGDTFIQCARASVYTPDKSRLDYLLEYQDGSENEHYRAIGEPITLARVLSAFLKYLRGDASFRTDFPWGKVDLER
jgi:hypothetical protein